MCVISWSMSHMPPSDIITACDSIEVSILGSGCDVISSLLFFISYSSSSSFTAGDRFLWFECLFLSSFNWIWSQTKDQGKRKAVQSNTRSLVFVTLIPLSLFFSRVSSIKAVYNLLPVARIFSLKAYVLHQQDLMYNMTWSIPSSHFIPLPFPSLCQSELCLKGKSWFLILLILTPREEPLFSAVSWWTHSRILVLFILDI